MTPTPNFDHLLRAAADQSEPQRLLFVFAIVELPADATPAERDRFEAGQGGALAPILCVDKDPRELASFQALLAESQAAGPPWQVVFAAALPGLEGSAPAKPEIDRALQVMVEAVRAGGAGRFAAFDPTGEPLLFR